MTKRPMMTTTATKNTIVNDGTMMTQTTRKNVTVFYSDSSQSIKSHTATLPSATAEGITSSVASPPQPQSNYVIRVIQPATARWEKPDARPSRV